MRKNSVLYSSLILWKSFYLGVMWFYGMQQNIVFLKRGMKA